jgi:hypothetical protein
MSSSNELTASLNQSDPNLQMHIMQQQQQSNATYGHVDAPSLKLEVSIKTEKLQSQNHHVDTLLSTSLSSSNTSTSSASHSFSSSSKSNLMSPQLNMKEHTILTQQQPQPNHNWSVNSNNYQINHQYPYLNTQNELFRHSIHNYPQHPTSTSSASLPHHPYGNGTTGLFSNFNMIQPLSSSSPATLAASATSAVATTISPSPCDSHQNNGYGDSYQFYNQISYQNPASYHHHHNQHHPSHFMNASPLANAPNTAPNNNLQFNYGNMYSNGNLIQPSSHSWNSN